MAGGLAGRVVVAGIQGASRDGASGGGASRATCGDGESVREGKTRGSAMESTLPELGDPAAGALVGVAARGRGGAALGGVKEVFRRPSGTPIDGVDANPRRENGGGGGAESGEVGG